MSDTDFSDVLAELDGTEASEEEVTPEPEVAAEAPRDDKGRFVAKAQVDEVTAEYLTRFGMEGDEYASLPDTAQKAIKSAAHQESLLGRQGQQMDELRRQIDNLTQRIPEPTAQAPNLTESQFEALVESNPRAAADLARKVDPSGALEEYVLNSWAIESPAAVTQYQIDKAMGRFEEGIAKSITPLREQARETQIGRVWGAVRRDIPDLEQYAGKIYDLAQGRGRDMLEAAFLSEDPQRQQDAIRNLYELAKFEELQTGGAVHTPEPEPDSFVASGSQVREPETKSEEEKWLERNFDPWAFEEDLR